MRWRLGIRVFLGALALVAAACGGAGEEPEAAPESEQATEATDEAEATEATDQEASPEGEETGAAASSGDGLTIGLAQDFPILDIRREGGSAASFTMLRHITEPLVFFSADGEMRPVLAEEWEQVDDTTMRFNLREGVTFHNGEPFNAEAAAFSIEQVLDPEFPAWVKYATDPLIEGVEVVDEYTIDVTTKNPSNILLNVLTIVDMVEPAYIESGAQDTEPIGTGPYRFAEFVPRSQLVMEAYEDYWAGRPPIPSITVRILPEESTRVQALLAGEVQMINALSAEDVARINENEATTIASVETARPIIFALRHDRPPLDDVRVRQAMNYAIDKQAIVDSLLAGIASVLEGPLPPSLPNSQTDLGPWPYDPERAQALLAEAGYAGEEITLALGAGRYPSDDEVGLAVADQLQAAGFNINYVATDLSTLQTELALKEDASYDAWLTGWGASLLDPIEVLQAYWGEESAVPMFYGNAELHEALATASGTTDQQTIDQAVIEAQQIAWEDAAAVFMYVPVENNGISRRLQGFESRFDEFFFFAGGWLDEPVTLAAG